MEELSLEDKELIALAKEAIEKNYDGKEFLHTVGAAIRCQDGKVFVGVNVYSLHGTCAEQVALGCAITAGERKFETIVPSKERQGKSSPLVETVGRSFPTICPRPMSSSARTERSERSRQRSCFRLLTTCLTKRKQQTRLSNRFYKIDSLWSTFDKRRELRFLTWLFTFIRKGFAFEKAGRL